jgi:hypothetical protein
MATSSTDRPWLKNRQWASGRCYDRTNRFAIASAIFTIIFGTITGLVIYNIPADPHNPAPWVMAVVFGVPAVAMGIWTIREIMVRVKFGRSVFEMETIPGAVGGWLAGTIRVPVKLDAEKGMRLELECTSSTQVRTIDGKLSNRTATLRSMKQTLSRDLPVENGCTCIPVAFRIPARERATAKQRYETITWKLHARASQPGADYDASFIVPVYHVADATLETPRIEADAARLRSSHSASKAQD